MTYQAQSIQEAKRSQKSTAYAPYDFRAEQEIGADRRRSLQALFSLFLRLGHSALTMLLRECPQMSLAGINQMIYAEYANTAPSPGCFFAVLTKEPEDRFLADVALPIAYTVVDRLLGGQGDLPETNERELSEIEQRVASRFVRALVDDLEKAWAQYKKIDLTVDTCTGDLQFVQLIESTEPVIIVSVEFALGEVSDVIRFVLPGSLLEEGLPRVNQTQARPERSSHGSDNDARILHQQVVHAKVPIRAQLGEAVITFQDLMGLEEGDVLTLDRLIGEPVDLLLGSDARFRGTPGLYRGHRAVKISEEVVEKDSRPSAGDKSAVG